MDDIELLLREARPPSGRRDRPLSARAERELAALVGSSGAQRDETDRAPARRTKRPGAPRSQRRTLLVLLVAAVAAVVAGVGIEAVVERASSVPRQVAGVETPDPSSVLRTATARLRDGSAAESGAESSSKSQQAEERLPDLTNASAVVTWLTSGTASREDQARLLETLAKSNRAMSVARSTGESAEVVWHVDIRVATLVIEASTGAIVSVVDSDGIVRAVTPVE